jgi:hypothetical protein
MFLNMGNKYINVLGNSNEFNTGTGLLLRNAYSGHGFTCIYFGIDTSFNAGAVWQGSSNYTYYAGPSSMNIGTLINSPLGLVAGNSVRMFITSGGNIGVGTNTPQAKLDVVGDVKATNTPKAWVSFDGTGGTGNQNIYSQYNISSVVKAADGRYTVNFANALSNSNYCITGNTGGTGGYGMAVLGSQWADADGGLQTTASFRIGTYSPQNGSWRNMSIVNVVIYGS